LGERNRYGKSNRQIIRVTFNFIETKYSARSQPGRRERGPLKSNQIMTSAGRRKGNCGSKLVVSCKISFGLPQEQMEGRG
jgi:hypothetical protein